MFGEWLHTTCMEGSEGYRSWFIRTGFGIQAHKGDIFLFEHDGKAGGFFHQSGTVKILPAYEITVCIPEGRSTEAALHNFVQKIEVSLNQKEFTLGVFLGIDGAFDNASFGSMYAASCEHGVVLAFRRWIDAMLRCWREWS
jgi:hypothetical protein